MNFATCPPLTDLSPLAMIQTHPQRRGPRLLFIDVDQ
jgi:hypothetical protein